jgi:hypothetical protein
MTKQRVKIIFYIVFLSGILFFVISTWLDVRRINLSAREELPSTDSINSEYLNLIAKKNQIKVKVEQVYQSKIRYPVAELYFEENNILFINKISRIGTFPLAERVLNETKNATLSKEVVYSTLKKGSCEFTYKLAGIDSISKIYLTSFGDSLTTIISNDSILAYHLICKNLSIRYNKNGPVDMLLEGQQGLFGIKEFPADLLFIRRNNALYLLLMISRSGGSVKPGLLYHIVYGE